MDRDDKMTGTGVHKHLVPHYLIALHILHPYPHRFNFSVP